MKKEELKKLNVSELKKEAFLLKKELFNLGMSASVGEVKDYSQFKKLRANISCCLTFLNQNKNEKESNKKA